MDLILEQQAIINNTKRIKEFRFANPNAIEIGRFKIGVYRTPKSEINAVKDSYHFCMVGASYSSDGLANFDDWLIAGLEQRGHRVSRLIVNAKIVHRYGGIRGLQEILRVQLKRIYNNLQPDIFWVTHGGGLWSKEMVEDANDAGLITMFYGVDDIVLFDSISRHLTPSFDHVFTFPFVKSVYKEQLNIDTIDFYFCANPFVVGGQEPNLIEKKKYESDIILTGNVHGIRKSPRLMYLLQFYLAGLDIKYFGCDNLNKIPQASKIWQGYFRSREEENRAYRSSKISFSLTQQINCYGKRSQSITSKMLDGGAAGCLILTNDFPDLATGFNSDEVVVYSSVEDAVEKAKYYLDHPKERIEIAQRGQKRCLEDHTITQRVKTIESLLQKGK